MYNIVLQVRCGTCIDVLCYIVILCYFVAQHVILWLYMMWYDITLIYITTVLYFIPYCLTFCCYIYIYIKVLLYCILYCFHTMCHITPLSFLRSRYRFPGWAVYTQSFPFEGFMKFIPKIKPFMCVVYAGFICGAFFLGFLDMTHEWHIMMVTHGDRCFISGGCVFKGYHHVINIQHLQF